MAVTSTSIPSSSIPGRFTGSTDTTTKTHPTFFNIRLTIVVPPCEGLIPIKEIFKPNMEVANLIRGQREKKGIELDGADALLSLPPGTAAKAEQPGGLAKIGIKKLGRLAKAYDISAGDLLEIASRMKASIQQ